MRFKAAIFLILTAFGLHTTAATGAEEKEPTTVAAITGGEEPTTATARTALEEPETDYTLNQGMQSVAKDPEFPDQYFTLRPADQISSDQPMLKLPSLGSDNSNLLERIRSGFTLADLGSPLIKEHEAWYANRPDYVRRMMERSQRYLFHIVEEVEKRGMPTEIALLPMIESAYNPKAYSTSHASGIWQFIPSTGKNFGLNQNWLYDGRRDIIAATDAALDYLQKLYNMFGSWELALAAYNWGEGSVGRAIAKNLARGEPTDYLSLRMPPETRNYVPKLMAMKNIIMNPAAYGLELNSIPNSAYFAKVKIKQQMDVAVAARLAEVPMDEFVALNPAYNKPLLAGSGKPTLLLPVAKVNSFSLNLENYESPLSSWQTYTPHHGEKLNVIAQHFGISLARLKEINSIGGRKKQVAAQTLLVPISKSANAPALAANIPEQEPAYKLASSSHNTTHTVAKGDTVLTIAKRYGMSLAQLKTQNHLKSNRLTRGQRLTVVAAAKPEKTVVVAQVKLAPAKSTKAKPVVVAKNAVDSGKNSRYVVKRGDTVFSIARRFNVAVNDLQRWNNLPASHNLQPGNKLTVISPKG